MEPRTKYKMTIIGLVVAGILFLGFGIYFFASFTSRPTSPHMKASLLFGGGGAIVIGLTMVWRGMQWARPIRETVQKQPVECPNCGAIIEICATHCEKCNTTLTGKPHS